MKDDLLSNIVNSDTDDKFPLSEGIMPDFSNTVRDKNGDIWCFEPESESVVRINIEKPVYTTIPQEVLLDLLKAEGKRRKP